MKRALFTLLIFASVGLRADPAADAYREAHALLKAKKFAEAASRFEAATSTTNATFAAAAWFGRGEAFFSLRQWQDAIAAYDHLLKAYPDGELAPKALYARGCAEQQAGRLPLARSTFSEFNARFPTHALAPACTSALDTLTRDLDAASKRKERESVAKELADINAFVHGARFAEAREAAERFLEAHAEHAQAADLRFLVATCAYKAKDYSRAAAYYRTFLARHPQHPRAATARGQLADSLMQDRRYDEASLLLEAICRDTDDPHEKARATLSLGDCDTAQGKWNEAERRYLSVEVLQESDALRPVALGHLADMYEKSGQADKARRTREDRRRRYPSE